MESCKTEKDDTKEFWRRFKDKLIGYSKHESMPELNNTCQYPCSSVSFRTAYVHIKYLATNNQNSTGRNRVLFTRASHLVTISDETLMYDFTAIVSSIGGGIGIFLGFSCYGIFSNLLSKLYSKIIV